MTCRAHPSVLATAVVGALLAALVLMSLIFMLLRAEAHDALPTSAQPLGWSYPISCCSGVDCRRVAIGDVREGPDGYVTLSGEVVSYGDKRIKDSPDGEFHWCTVGGTDTGRTLCLFVPPRGF